ncbi:MAG: heparinase II/III family protein [Opitutales bacterium]|nr:heparinase II/III family protein [Opitutales bacterium]
MIGCLLNMLAISGCSEGIGDSIENQLTGKFVLRSNIDNAERFSDFNSYLELSIFSERASGARVEIRINDVNGQQAAALVFAVDWEGLNQIRLPLSSIALAGERMDLDFSGRKKIPIKQVHQEIERFGHLYLKDVELVEVSAGFRETDLSVQHVRMRRGSALWEVNESDAILELGWRSTFAQIGDWQVVPEATTVDVDTLRVHTEPWVGFEWDSQGEPKVLTLRREVDIPLGDFDRMLAKLTWDWETAVTLRAIVDDGRTIDVTESTESAGSFLTIGGDLDDATHLRAIELEFREKQTVDRDERSPGVGLFHVLLRKPSEWDEVEVVEREVVFEPGRGDRMDTGVVSRRIAVPQLPFVVRDRVLASALPEAEPEIPFGFLFDRSDLYELRSKVDSDMGRRLFEAVHQTAKGAVERDYVYREGRHHMHSRDGIIDRLDPDELHDTWMTVGGVGLPIGAYGAGVDAYIAQAALTYLVTGDREYAAAAKTWLLRFAESPDLRGAHGVPYRPFVGGRGYYVDSFTSRYPKGWSGYMDAPLYQSQAAFSIMLAYDWIYHLLTDEERRKVEDALARTGLFVPFDKLHNNPEFYLGMNQGAIFSGPLLMQLQALRDKDEDYAKMYDWVGDFFKDFATGTWLIDGVGTEGPGYLNGTLFYFVRALGVYSRLTETPVRDIAGPDLGRSFDYLLHTRLPVAEGSHIGAIPWSDASRQNRLHPTVLGFFHREYQRGEALEYLKRALDDNPADAGRDPLLFINYRDWPEAKKVELPPVHYFENQPLLFYRDGIDFRSTVFAATNMRYYDGHFHKDRGSFILSYNGELLMTDPGNHSYYHPRSGRQVETAVHSTLTFGQADQLSGDDPYDLSLVSVASTSGRKTPGEPHGIDWGVMDVGAVYAEAERYERQFIWMRPGVFAVVDALDCHEPESFELNFHALTSVEEHEDGRLVAETDSNRLTLFAVSNIDLEPRFARWILSWDESHETQRVQLSTVQPESSARVLTVMIPQSLDATPPEIEQIETGDAYGLRIRLEGEEYHLVLNPDASRVEFDKVSSDAGVFAWKTDGEGNLLSAGMNQGKQLFYDSKPVLRQHGGGTTLFSQGTAGYQFGQDRLDRDVFYPVTDLEVGPVDNARVVGHGLNRIWVWSQDGSPVRLPVYTMSPLKAFGLDGAEVALTPGWDGRLAYSHYWLEIEPLDGKPGLIEVAIDIEHPVRSPMAEDPLGIQKYEKKLRERKSAFPSTQDEFLKWREESRNTLADVFLDGPVEQQEILDLEPEKIRTYHYEDFYVERIRITTQENRRIDLLLSRPREYEGKLPLMVGLHGHETRWGAAVIEAFEEGHINDFCAYFAKRGYAVLQPATMDYTLQNEDWTLIGEWTWDAMRAIDYALEQPEIDSGRVGTVGLSAGGWIVMNLLAFDERVTTGVVGCILSTWNHYDKRFRFPPHSDAGLQKQLEPYMDQADWAALLAPKRVQYQQGLKDASLGPGSDPTYLMLSWNNGVMPREEYDVMFREIERAYRILGAENKLEGIFHEGGHAVNNEAAFEWFQKSYNNNN